MDRPTVAIVGHGPSMLENQYGEDIDSHDHVMRMKWHEELTLQPEHFGKRTDSVCCSAIVAPKVAKMWHSVTQFYIFTDTRTRDWSTQHLQTLAENFGRDVVLDAPLCEFWDMMYRMFLNGEEGEPHLSAGSKAIIYALKYMNPSKLALYGFDSVTSGKWTWSITRGEDYKNYPKHRFDIEHPMLTSYATVYNTQIMYPDSGENQ